LEEDMEINVLTSDDSFPRKPDPRRYLPPVPTDPEAILTEEQKAAVVVMEAARWADVDPDGDTWDGMFLSVDLLEPLAEGGDESS
jgi:COMPASS component SWD1